MLSVLREAEKIWIHTGEKGYVTTETGLGVMGPHTGMLADT